MTRTPAETHLFDALAWRLEALQPGLRDGGHPGRMRGAGDAFADVAPLMAHPDARRLDLRRSLTDPFGGFVVRRFHRRTDVTLHLMLDASASLAAGAAADRQGLAALLVAGLAQAARRGGDLAALDAIGGTRVLATQPPSRRDGMIDDLRGMVTALTPSGTGIAGLADLAQTLPTRRILVALISDFELSPLELDSLLSALAPRPVLPLWLRDSGLESPPARIGLIDAHDPETGRRRILLATPRWAARQVQAGAEHRRKLRAVFADHGLRPVEITDSIDIADLTAALCGAPL